VSKIFTLPTTDGFTLRPFQLSDAPGVVALINADAARSIGIRRAVLDAVGQVRLARYVPPSAEKVVALDAGGQVIGYAYLADREQSIVYETGGAVQPAFHGQGIGSLLLSWAEERAAALSLAALPGVKTLLQVNVFEAEAEALSLLEDSGFTHVRDWLHFTIDLTAPPRLPILPEGISLHPMDLDKDWDLVGPAMEEAFAEHWGAIALPPSTEDEAGSGEDEEIPEDDSYSNAPGFCFYARRGDQAVGGVLCNAKLVERDDSGRVGSLFVRPAYRRRGIGQALMRTAFSAFWRHGLRRIILDTDAESFSAAPRFYTRLGMQVYRRERLYEKVIRPGVEARLLHRPGSGVEQ
jgi:GNAT superfamily N-acetyltransferase